MHLREIFTLNKCPYFLGDSVLEFHLTLWRSLEHTGWSLHDSEPDGIFSSDMQGLTVLASGAPRLICQF